MAPAIRQSSRARPAPPGSSALIVEDESLFQIFTKACRGPLAKLRASKTANAVTDRQDGLKGVVLYFAVAPRFPSVRTIRNFRIVASPTLSFIVNIYQVLTYGANVYLKKLADQGLREPDRLVLKSTFNARAAVLRLVKDDFRVGSRRVWALMALDESYDLKDDCGRCRMMSGRISDTIIGDSRTPSIRTGPKVKLPDETPLPHSVPALQCSKGDSPIFADTKIGTCPRG